jgi:hypothetical protein
MQLRHNPVSQGGIAQRPIHANREDAHGGASAFSNDDDFGVPPPRFARCDAENLETIGFFVSHGLSNGLDVLDTTIHYASDRNVCFLRRAQRDDTDSFNPRARLSQAFDESVGELSL